MIDGRVMVDLQGTTIQANERAILAHPHTGAVILFKENYQSPAQIKQLVSDVRDCAGKPILVVVDHEGGRIWRFEPGFTKTPAAHLFGDLLQHHRGKAMQQAEYAGTLIAQELLECGIDLSLAPVLDLDQGVNPAIRGRAFHRDPQIVTALAGAFIKGMHSVGMACMGKHFPGHGACVADTHFDVAVDDRSFAEIKQNDLFPYKHLNDSLDAVMMSHVIYPEVDAVPPCFSLRWHQILREELDFQGAVLSDCMSMKALDAYGSMGERTQKALDAGCDMVILSHQPRELLIEVLNELCAEASDETRRRLSHLAGDFESKRYLKAKPSMAELDQFVITVEG